MNSSLQNSDVSILQVQKPPEGFRVKLTVQITSQNKGLWKILPQKKFLAWEN